MKNTLDFVEIKNWKQFEDLAVAYFAKDAVYYTIGFPEKENDWGRGGKQFIYFNNTLFVYIDGTEHVADWQSLER
jgi:hypothetical protein